MMKVREMFFYVQVRDMERAIAFYVTAFGAIVDHASAAWSSLVIAGVRVNLVPRDQESASAAMHFIVDDIAVASADVARAGGEIEPAFEETHSVVAEALDTEGNTFTLRQVRPLSLVHNEQKVIVEPSLLTSQAA